MSNNLINDIITTIIQPDRLAPQDAEDKKRHKHRRRHSSDRRADEDDGGRRDGKEHRSRSRVDVDYDKRRRDDKSRDGHRARSRVDDEGDRRHRHRDNSTSKRRDRPGDEDRFEPSAALKRAMRDEMTLPADQYIFRRRSSREPRPSRRMEYGEHHFDDTIGGGGEEKHGHRRRRSSYHRSKSRRRDDEDERERDHHRAGEPCQRRDTSAVPGEYVPDRTRPTRDTAQEAYDDHRFDYYNPRPNDGTYAIESNIDA